MAELTVPTPTITTATAQSLGPMSNLAPINFYNPLPAKDYSTGLVDSTPKTNSDIAQQLAFDIVGKGVQDIMKNKALDNKLTTTRNVDYDITKRYQDPELGYIDGGNNEYIYGENQGLASAIGNSMLQSAGNFASSFLGSLNFL